MEGGVVGRKEKKMPAAAKKKDDGGVAILRGVIHGPSEYRSADNYRGMHVTQEELHEIDRERSLVDKPVYVEHLAIPARRAGTVRRTWMCPRSGALCGEVELDLRHTPGKRALEDFTSGERRFFSLGHSKFVDMDTIAQGSFGSRRVRELSIVREPARPEARIVSHHVLGGGGDDERHATAIMPPPLERDPELLNFISTTFSSEAPTKRRNVPAIFSMSAPEQGSNNNNNDVQSQEQVASGNHQEQQQELRLVQLIDEEAAHKRKLEAPAEEAAAAARKKAAIEPAEFERQRQKLLEKLQLSEQLESMNPEELNTYRDNLRKQLSNVDQNWLEANADLIRQVFDSIGQPERADTVIDSYNKLVQKGDLEAAASMRQMAMAYSARERKMVDSIERRYKEEAQRLKLEEEKRQKMQEARIANEQMLQQASRRNAPVSSMNIIGGAPRMDLVDFRKFEGSTTTTTTPAAEPMRQQPAAVPPPQTKFPASLLNNQEFYEHVLKSGAVDAANVTTRPW